MTDAALQFNAHVAALLFNLASQCTMAVLAKFHCSSIFAMPMPLRFVCYHLPYKMHYDVWISLTYSMADGNICRKRDAIET